jgi:EAL and modified HD-GYP domain-containing signal transduction protein
MQNLFLGRQPILDRDLKVFAYELLYRAGTDNVAGVLDGDRATSQVILNTFTEIGLKAIAGDHPVFINMTRGFLIGPPLPFPRGKVVLEVLEDIAVDEELILALRRLAGDGYEIALDDFIFHESLRPLVELAHYIKLDVRAQDRATTKTHLREFARYPVKLLAEKIETLEEFEFYKGLGFDYFQGYFLQKPRIIQGSRTPASRRSSLDLLVRLRDPEVEIQDIEPLIARDVALSYRLLRLVNSALFTLPKRVDSIQQTILYLGLDTVRRWASLLVMAGFDDKPQAVLGMALTRARMCEQLARQHGEPQPERFYTVGLFSLLDVLLDQDLDRVLESLPLADDVRAALTAHAGPMGQALQCAIAYECGDWARVRCARLDEAGIRAAWLAAVSDSDQIMQTLAGM